MPRRLLITLSLLLLTSCLAPNGSTYTIATIDDANTMQIQIVEVSAEQEFYRGAFAVCLMVTYADVGSPDAPGCHEFVATLYASDAYRDETVLELWNSELTEQQ